MKLVECPRDAWQGLKRQIPTEIKAHHLRGLIDAGFRHIDAVSFVSPKAVPQMADSEQVLELLGPTEGVEIIGIVVNDRGVERAIATGAVSTLGYPCSVSETFLRRNQNQSPEENFATLGSIVRKGRDAGLGVVAYISMAFGNPYGDAWNEEQLAQVVRTIAASGVDSISVSDTVGMADPALIARVAGAVINASAGVEAGVHLHSTRATAADKILAAYDAGVRRFDAALGGLGGCPFAQDELVGNIPTEEVLGALEQRGVDLQIRDSLPSVIASNDAIAAKFAL